MTTYRIEVGWTLLYVGLALFFAMIFLWMRDASVLVLVAFFCLLTSFNLTSRIAVSDKEVRASVRILPFLPSWHKRLQWIDVVGIRALQNPFFAEADALLILARPVSGKEQRLFIPIAIYAHRQELIKQLFGSLPSQVKFSPDLVRWAERVGLTPRWQLGVALAFLLLLVGILWWSSVAH